LVDLGGLGGFGGGFIDIVFDSRNALLELNDTPADTSAYLRQTLTKNQHANGR